MFINKTPTRKLPYNMFKLKPLDQKKMEYLKNRLLKIRLKDKDPDLTDEFTSLKGASSKFRNSLASQNIDHKKIGEERSIRMPIVFP